MYYRPYKAPYCTCMIIQMKIYLVRGLQPIVSKDWPVLNNMNCYLNLVHFIEFPEFPSSNLADFINLVDL
jgi:hypothetical protein